MASRAFAPTELVAKPSSGMPAKGTADISVLTYNVKGLPWPLRLDLPDPDPDIAMSKIGRHLGALRAAGMAPDVVLIQEGFSGAAAKIGALGGYRYAASGPTQADALLKKLTAEDAELAAEADWALGETQGPLFDSGLHVFSDYQIAVRARAPFGRHACAGFDCLAAKGVLVVSIDVPGIPDPVAMFTLHMNANGASGAPEQRRLAAFHLQVDRFVDALNGAIDPASPVIFGGDFNVKTAAARRKYADQRLTGAGLSAVHMTCAVQVAACERRYGGPDDHWLAPRDVQGYRDGARVRVTPLSSEEVFAGPESGGRLSDHVGYLARYRLRAAP